MSELDFSAALEKIDIAPQPSAWLGHIPFGAWIVESLRPRVLVELGTHYGHSYFSFCQAVARARLNTKCYAVDLWEGDEHAGSYGEEVFSSVNSKNAQFETFSRLLRMTFDDAVKYFSDGSIDLLHIDGLHTYEAVKHDFESWKSKLSRHAIVLFHDINVRERDFGVWRLWEELSGAYPTIEFLHSHGLGVLFYGVDQSPIAVSLMKSFGTEAGRAYITRLFGELGRMIEVDRKVSDLSRTLTEKAESFVTAAAESKNQVTARDEHIAQLLLRNAAAANLLATKEAQISQFEKHAEVLRADRVKREAEWVNSQLLLDQALQREAALNASLQEVWASTSWKASSPIRWMGARVANMRAVKRLSLPASEAAGGRLRLARAVGRVLVQEGISGLKRRIVNFDQSGYAARTHTDPALEQRQTRYTVARHSETVDVIVCVHNALSDVKNCLSSLVAHTLPPYRIIVVDDGSDEETKNYLADFVRSQGGVLVRHEVARGYTLAANAGIRASDGKFIVLLNSDTVVSSQWLDRMIECATSDPRIGMVGPLSNTASWQSVPRIFDEAGDWSSNPLPSGIAISDMAQRVAMTSRRSYPRVGFLNGFCLLIRREQLSDVGLFDEENFGKGYGEENDLCVRAFSKGWQLAVADDVYVFHAQSKSYSTERRMKLAKAADENLHRKHESASIMNQLEITRYNLGLTAVRARMQVVNEQLLARKLIRHQFEGKRVLIILPVSHAGGGANVILSEATVLQECGIDVVIANIETARASFEISYPSCSLPKLWVSNWNQLSEYVDSYDAVIATLYSSVFWIRDALQANSLHKPVMGYYIQDFEPDFFPENSRNYQEALASYSEASMKLMTKTRWNQRKVMEKTGKSPLLLGPSFDWSRFAPPSGQRKSKEIVICAMVRPSTPRRGPQMTVNVLRRLLAERAGVVQVRIFGCPSNDPILAPLESFSGYQSYGELNSAEVEALMKRVDVFVDLSTYQAMGLSCLEAMASGVAVIGPVNGGISEIVIHEESGLLVDTLDEEQCTQTCLRLIDDGDLRQRLKTAGIERTASFFPEKPALTMMQALFSGDAETKAVQ
ncbi:class I SAM-dependent methyltransferase [Variovorax boronicumulans]|uniref:class I SAM-dependent methyltransferase n=1 Tax=Variovorax boronicumulans TaxID=436515 RepID=UPI0009EF4DD1|nr:class I SAM-dependent methyltransferase [Variovorax boronicumulans]